MGHSSLLGVDGASEEPMGRDVGTLGPSDSSDSGSDMAGLDYLDQTDPTEPVDSAMNADVPRTFAPLNAPDGASSDASGTGERGAAGNDGGRREAADISVDRVFDPMAEGEDDFDEDLDETEDPDLAFVDKAEAGEVLDEEPTDDEAL